MKTNNERNKGFHIGCELSLYAIVPTAVRYLQYEKPETPRQVNQFVYLRSDTVRSPGVQHTIVVLQLGNSNFSPPPRIPRGYYSLIEYTPVVVPIVF